MENVLVNVIGACVAGVVFVTLSGFPSTSYANENASPVVQNAIIALYVAGDQAQKAIDVDVCDNVDLIDTTRAGDALQGDAKRQYTLVRDALNVAYETVEGGDESLQGVDDAFCAGVSER